MDNLVSLDMLVELPVVVLENSDIYGSLLRKEEYIDYDIKSLKKKINDKFNRFKETKHFFNFSNDVNIVKSPQYDSIGIFGSNTSYSKVEQLVDKNIESQIWVSKFYYKMINLSYKLNKDESKYLIYTFFSEMSEELISEELKMSRTKLQKIKKSCLVKTWYELKNI